MTELGADLGRRGFLQMAAAASVMGLGISACSSGSTTGSKGGSATTGVLKIAASDGSTNDTLDPLRMERAMQILTACMIYESLVDVDEGLRPVGRLAKSFTTKDGGLTWTFALRPGVTFHDGTPLTSADVAYSIGRALDPKEGSGNSLAGQLDGILRPSGIKTPDKATVEFRLEKVYVFFPEAMSTRFARIYKAGTKDFSKPNGTGPFTFKSFEPARNFVALRYEGYWGDAPKLSRVEVINYANEATRLSAFLAGDVDLMFEIATSAAPDILATKGLSILEQKNAKWIPLAMDTTVAPFDNPDLVRAIKLGVDRDQIIKIGLGGYGEIGFDNPIPADDFYFAGLPKPVYDPSAAKAALAKAGYPQGIKLPSLVCLDLAAANSMALVLQQQLQKIGVRFEIKKESAATFWDDSWLSKPFYSNDYLRRSPDEILKLAFVSKGPWNISKRKDPEIDAAVAAAGKSTDKTIQKQEYAIAQRLISERDSTLVSAHLPRLSGIAKNVTAVTTNPVYFLDLRRAGVAV